MTGQDFIDYIWKYQLEGAEIFGDPSFVVVLPNGYWLKFDPYDDHVKYFGNEENEDFHEYISLEEAMKLREEENDI